MVELKVGHKIVFKRGSGEFVGVVVATSDRSEWLVKFEGGLRFTHSGYGTPSYLDDGTLYELDGIDTYYFVSSSCPVRIIGEV